jgi:peptide/nickel transport system ATP-binding protein
MTAQLEDAPVDTSRERRGLTVTGLTVVTKKHKTPVVKDVSFAVAGGRILGLVGESGSGKSTVGVALLGLARRGLEIAAGSVMIGDVDVLKMSNAELRRARGRLVAYVPQDPASGLNPALRIGTQLREALQVHPDALKDQTVDERVRELLVQVHLSDPERVLKSYPHQLSGGQQQRIGIAMAFACRPRLIVLDEPTTGLDVSTQRHVLDTVADLSTQYGATIVYVSHDLAVVGQIADETAVMYAGRLVEMGPTAALFEQARHHYTVGLLKAAPSPDRSTVLVGIEGNPPRPGKWPKGCCFADRCPAAEDDCRAALPEMIPLGPDHVARCLHPVPVTSDPGAGPAAVPTVGGRPGPALKIKGLNAHYGAAQVLHDVDFTVEPGTCTAIVGESGSGKTTLARCLTGLHADWTGDATFGDERLAPAAAKRTRELRQRLQFVFQNPFSSLNPRMSVGDNVEEPLWFFTGQSGPERRRKVVETLDTVALSREFYNRMPDQLSGGERQRVAVGRALTVGPELLVCDEVTSALDVSVQALLVEQLRDLQLTRGLSMVFITHNLAVVRSIAQNVIVLAAGRIVEAGPVADVLDHPTHDYTRQLLADLPKMSASAG